MSPRIITLAGATIEVFESCVYTWLFDDHRRRFRRLPRGRRIELDNPVSDWEAYDRLELDARTGTFVVVLNADGTRRLSAGWHDDRCPCGAMEPTRPVPQVATP